MILAGSDAICCQPKEETGERRIEIKDRQDRNDQQKEKTFEKKDIKVNQNRE